MAKVLIIEDDAAETFILKSAFEKQGYEVDSAKDGEEGIAKTKSFHPDLISLDLLLPGINGIEVLDRLKADAVTKTIPVIILSNVDNEKDIEIALSKGAIRYLPKSMYNLQQIIEIIQQVLTPQQPSKPPAQ